MSVRTLYVATFTSISQVLASAMLLLRFIGSRKARRWGGAGHVTGLVETGQRIFHVPRFN